MSVVQALVTALAVAILLLLVVLAFIALWRRLRAQLDATRELQDVQARRLLQERLAREKLDLEHQRASFLADVSKVIADALDPAAAVATVARLAVPFLADACVVDLTDDDGALLRVAVVTADPATVPALTQRFPATAPTHPLLARVLRHGRSEVVSHAHEADLVGPAERGHRPLSALLVPLLARERTLGVVSLFAIESGRRFGPDDLTLAEDVARRIALAVDNARLYRAADDAHHRFHDLVEGLGAIVWEADAVRRHYTFVSGRAVPMLGYSLVRWLDEPDFWLTIQYPEDRERANTESRTARGEGRDHDLEYRVVAADGRIVWVLDLVRLVRHADESVRHLRGVMVDVTAAKRTEQALREGEEARRHAEALASVAALANAAAHEINNPLSVIMGGLELLSRRADTPPILKARIEALLAAGRRIAAIVGRMGQITRLENVPPVADLPAMLDLDRSSTTKP